MLEAKEEIIFTINWPPTLGIHIYMELGQDKKGTVK